MKKLLLIIVLLASLAGGVLLWKKQTSASTTTATTLSTATVKRGPLRQTVQCTGSVVSNLDVEIKCKASGLVTSMPYDISQQVKKGDLLVEIDPIDQQRSTQQAEAALAASQAKLDQAKANLALAENNLSTAKKRAQADLCSAQAKKKDSSAKAEREKELLSRRQSSTEEAETAETTAVQSEQSLRSAEAAMEAIGGYEAQVEIQKQNIALCKAQVDSDTIALAIANQKLSETKVTAPIDGTISSRSVEVGQIIASGINNIGGGTSVLTVSDLSRVFVLASVDESDIGNVALDQPVDITVDAYPRKPFKGVVKRIATKGVSSSNVVTFEVKIEVSSDNKSLLKPLMTANVEIVAAERGADTLSIPLRAIVRKNEQTYVNKQTAPGAQELTPISIGLSDGNDVELLKSDLKEGDTVVCQRADADSRWRADNQKKDNGPPPMMMMGPPPGGKK